MRRSIILIGSLVLGMLLVACGSETIESTYTASGDGSRPSDLTRTTSFRADDDLNLIVKLGSHASDLEVYATFTTPDGITYTTDPIDAEPSVETLVLGLDWESQGVNNWPDGSWRATIFIDGEQAQELTFSVQPIDTGSAEG